MTMDEILAGESRNLEFKVQRPKNSTKYMKSVVAFANGEGGRIIFGVDDKTHQVVGIPKEILFSEVDAITTAISDSCEPVIIPDVYLQTIDDKTVIIADISEGKQRPYYIRSQGRDAGVYVRVSGTSRPADPYMIRELMFESASRSFDQMICMGWNIADGDIDTLCDEMKQQALKNARHREDVKDVGRQQLLSWGILVEKDGKFFPTNAFSILTGTGPIHTAMQCGVFKGNTKAVFVDRREYNGPIWKQIDEAYSFVLRNIHLGAKIVGIYRQDVYEIPEDCIRELIINAAVHRSYLDHNNIQVAVYDDRLEITSPGKLPMGQTIERMKNGYSRIRNEALANAFSYMNLIEHWGSGIPRIIQEVAEAGLKAPEILGGEVDLRINVYRKESAINDLSAGSEKTDESSEKTDAGSEKTGKSSEKKDVSSEKKAMRFREDMSQTQVQILSQIQTDPEISAAKIAEKIGISSRAVEKNIKLLREKSILIRHGADKGGYWEIIDMEK